MKISINVLLVSLLLLACISCSNNQRALRGEEVKSTDGLTYLVIEEGNGCEAILVDGVKWEYDIRGKGPIKAGTHTIDCNGKIEFEIKEGTTFHFDYWGP